MTARVQRGVLAVLLAVAAASALVATLVGTQTWDAALLNFGTEMAGAVVTYGLLHRVIGGRERKEDLIAQMGSDVRDVAVHAANELRRHGWLTDGSLTGADLRKDGLSEADLHEANLSRADLSRANLSEAILSGATVTPFRLAQAASLTGAIMPDGTKH